MHTMTSRRPLQPPVTITAGRIAVVDVPAVEATPGPATRHLARQAARLANHLAEFVDELRDFHDRHCRDQEAGEFTVPASPDPLTVQERAICELIAGGATHKRAAGQLDVSVRTVEGRLRAARIRLGLASNLQLVARFARQGEPP